MPDLNEVLNTYFPALASSTELFPPIRVMIHGRSSAAQLILSRAWMSVALSRAGHPFFQLTPTTVAFSNSLSSSGPLHSASRFAGLASRVVGTSRPRAVRLWSPVLSVERPTR